MKIIIFFLIFTCMNLFSYDFSNDLPKNTLFYLTVKDFKVLNEKLDKTSTGKFYKSKEFKPIEKNLKKLASLMIYNEEQDMNKINNFYKNLKKLALNPFVFSIGLSKFFKPQLAILIKGKDLNKTFETMYRDFLKKDFKKGNVKIKKEIYKGIKINIWEIKREVNHKKNIYRNYKKTLKKENNKVIYAIINDKLIITESREYMNLIISTIKNKSIPRLSNNLIFKKDYQKYKSSDFYMFVDLKTILRLMSADKEMKQIIDNYSLKKLDSLISYFEFKNNDYDIFIKLISSDTLPVIIKDVLFKNTVISIPQFIPETCYSFNAISIDFSKFLDLTSKFQTERERRKLRKFETQIGITLKEIVNSFGKTIYYLSFFKDSKTGSVFLFTFARPKFLLKLITTIGSNPMVGIVTKDYLDGKIITASGSFSMIGYALGYKNNNFIFGDTKTVREIMQKMSGNSGSFYNSKFYKEFIKVMNGKQSAVSFTKSSTSIYVLAKDFQKTFKKEYKMGSDKKEMKILKTIKTIVDSLAGYTITELEKYFSYSFAKAYTNKNELIFKIK